MDRTGPKPAPKGNPLSPIREDEEGEFGTPDSPLRKMAPSSTGENEAGELGRVGLSFQEDGLENLASGRRTNRPERQPGGVEVVVAGNQRI